MVGMEMGQEYSRDVGRIDRNSRHAGRRATAGIKEQPFGTCQHQCADAKSLGVKGWASLCPEKNHSHVLLAARGLSTLPLEAGR
jgi:hypothetical protein